MLFIRAVFSGSSLVLFIAQGSVAAAVHSRSTQSLNSAADDSSGGAVQSSGTSSFVALRASAAERTRRAFVDAAPNSPSGSIGRSTHDKSAETALLQVLLNISQHRGHASPTSYGTGRENASSVVHTPAVRASGRLSEAIVADLAEIWNEVREHHSESANRTVKLVHQMALESAVLMADMRSLEQQSMQTLGKVGPSHAYPHLHVVGRRHLQAQPGTHQGLSFQPSGPTLGSIRLLMTAAGALVIALFACLNTNRKALGMTVFGKVGPRRQTHTAANLCLLHASASAGSLEEEENNDGLTVWDGSVAAFSCIFGTGLLAMPYAFSLAGMVAVPILVFFVCCSAYTARLMAESLNELGAFSLGRLAEAAFGRRARTATDAFLVVELWGYLLSSLVCGSMNVSRLLSDLAAEQEEGIIDDDGRSMTWAVGVSALIVYLLSSFLPSRVMTRVNVASNAFFVACCLMFIATGLMLPAKAPATDVQLLKPDGIIPAAGILIFSPAGHSFYPALMQRMKEPAQFPACLRHAYVAACALYLLVAVSGYYLFGNAAQPSAVMNIGSDLALVPLPHLGWMSSLAAFGMSVKMLALAALVLVPLRSTLMSIFVGRLSGEQLSLAVTLCILLVSAAVAVHFAHEMARLLNLLGSVFCMNIAFVLPVICHWKLAKEPVGCLRQAVFIILIAMGTCFAVLGFASAL